MVKFQVSIYSFKFQSKKCERPFKKKKSNQIKKKAHDDLSHSFLILQPAKKRQFIFV